MEQQYSAGCELCHVGLHCLLRNEVGWDGIRTKCVQHQKVESAVRLSRQLEPSVTDDDIAVRAAAGEKTEVFTGDCLDRRVDFIKRDVVGRVAISRHTPCAQTDHREALPGF